MSLARRFDQKGRVIILSETTDEPITFLGAIAGVCYGSDTSDNEKNYKRGLSCLSSGHLRAAEFPQIYMILSGWSAKVIREWYTHIIDTTRLQASTRYINYDNFDYVVPPSIKNNDEADNIYETFMDTAKFTLKELEDIGIPKEDASCVLPLNYSTKIVVRVGMRELMNIMEQRRCTRAYHEMRELCKEILDALAIYSDEWKELIDTGYFGCKCDKLGYCPEEHGCGKEISKSEFKKFIELANYCYKHNISIEELAVNITEGYL